MDMPELLALVAAPIYVNLISVNGGSVSKESLMNIAIQDAKKLIDRAQKFAYKD